MADHNDLGNKGEDKAVAFLKSKGYRIIERNWTFHGYEIDIIAEDSEFIIFTSSIPYCLSPISDSPLSFSKILLYSISSFCINLIHE
jgi:hypothetical protein